MEIPKKTRIPKEATKTNRPAQGVPEWKFQTKIYSFGRTGPWIVIVLQGQDPASLRVCEWVDTFSYLGRTELSCFYPPSRGDSGGGFQSENDHSWTPASQVQITLIFN